MKNLRHTAIEHFDGSAQGRAKAEKGIRLHIGAMRGDFAVAGEGPAGGGCAARIGIPSYKQPVEQPAPALMCCH